jgi:transcriptional regulator with XRE-family HTH domain
VTFPVQVPKPEEQAEAALRRLIGGRVLAYRTREGVTITELAERAGVSKGMLSKIENAHASPSLATLARIAESLDLPITAFLADFEARTAKFVKAGHGLDLIPASAAAHTRTQLLGTMAESSRRMEPLLVTLGRGAKVSPIFRHTGVEFLYQLEGVMEYVIGEARFLMEPGDSLQFEGEITHGPGRLVKTPVRFLSIKVHALDERQGDHRID